MSPHQLWSSIGDPAPPYYRIVGDIEQLFECLTRIDTEFMFSSLGLVCFSDRRCVGILSFLGVEQSQSVLEVIRRATRSQFVCALLTARS